ncbi:response regulator [Flavobacterium orientale]|uniref:Response regulator n=1 Tax=Flavobacterium orientale TaxID=1756020 RepID=A0A917DE23_9FLAO|nr:response regulator [Flavobacterium orientale]GGD30744.1 response regulator [Flavobacterium orientale]
MNRKGPIVIIEDDADDQEIIKQALDALDYDNELIFFLDSNEALEYLTEKDVEPFIVFSDINMPKLNGIELREKIHENESLRSKSIPFLFFSTSAEQNHIVDAYSKSVQGFFIKPSKYKEVKDIMKVILDYWSKCVSPNYIK